MHDGTTPLILAARLAIEGMVEDLINADADINAADNSGKTALHWGAAVNNVDAVNILLSHGANRDAQDDKVNPPDMWCGMFPSFHLTKCLVSITSCSEFENVLQYPVVAHYLVCSKM
jgi:Notch-like protein